MSHKEKPQCFLAKVTGSVHASAQLGWRCCCTTEEKYDSVSQTRRDDRVKWEFVQQFRQSAAKTDETKAIAEKKQSFRSRHNHEAIRHK